MNQVLIKYEGKKIKRLSLYGEHQSDIAWEEFKREIEERKEGEDIRIMSDAALIDYIEGKNLSTLTITEQ